MTDPTPSPRLFTAEAANKMLPLVAAIVGDLEPLWRSVSSTSKRIQHLTDNRGDDYSDLYSEELLAVGERLERDSQRVNGFIDELREIGLEFKGSGQQCHVCFPTMLDGKLVYLSWARGESEVTHWVDLDGTFADRQSLFASPLVTSE